MKELLDTSIESRIIHLLKGGALSTIKIIEKVQEGRLGTPKQSVYLALRKLKKKEVVAISGKIVALHEVWISKMKNFFAEAGVGDALALRTKTRADILALEEGESISYIFHSLLALDMFWAHAFMIFMRSMVRGRPILVYNPHQWFLIAREQSETSIIREVKKRHIAWLQIVGGSTTLDREIKKYFDSPYARSHFFEKSIFPSNYYVNCFGDFLIEVWIDERAAGKIEEFYRVYEAVDLNARARLWEIIKEKNYKHKMKISKNATKALKIKKIFKKYFLIPD